MISELLTPVIPTSVFKKIKLTFCKGSFRWFLFKYLQRGRRRKPLSCLSLPLLVMFQHTDSFVCFEDQRAQNIQEEHFRLKILKIMLCLGFNFPFAISQGALHYLPLISSENVRQNIIHNYHSSIFFFSKGRYVDVSILSFFLFHFDLYPLKHIMKPET